MSIVLLFMMVWHLILVDELKNDYRNPMDFAKVMNRLVLPEYCLHLALPVVFFLSGCWFSFLLNVPLVAYHVWRYLKRPAMSGPGIYDPTMVMNRDELSRYTKEGFIKCGFYVLTFLFYLYNMLVALITSLIGK